MKIALIGGYDSNLMLRMLREESPDIIGVHYNILPNSYEEQKHLPENCLVYTIPFSNKAGIVPTLDGRDLLFCTDICIRHNVEEIYLGHLPEEISLHPDCSMEYPEMLTKILSYTFGRDIKVFHPLVEREITKQDLQKWAEFRGIETSHLVSCFQVPACGKCPKCEARKWN